MSFLPPNRWRRPAIWAALALLLGAVFSWNQPAGAAPPLRPAAEQADFIRIEKAARRLTLLRDGTPIAVYRVALGFAPVGDKRAEGDGRTPEGRYRIDRRNDRSAFHLSLGLNYPRADQRAAARAEGRNPGGDIFIHGQPNSMPGRLTLPGDWTAGCIALSDAEIREIWSRVPIGTPVEVLP